MTPYYETDRALSEYLLFHYGESARLLPWRFGPRDGLEYPVRCVAELLDRDRLAEHARALDIGCAVGRSSFELARHCREVVGIDFSGAFITAAAQLRSNGALRYQFVVEGEIRETAIARIADDIDRDRVAFERGDAMDLRADLGRFEVVLLANLLCRLSDPARCLAQMGPLVKPGGQLLITTPCTWLEEYTPRANWLGGLERDGRPIRTLDRLREILEPHFRLTTLRDLPFLIREHERKFQWTVAEGSTWIRRDDAAG